MKTATIKNSSVLLIR